MKRSGTRTLIQGACVAIVLALVAIPLSNLMVAQTSVPSTSEVSVLSDTAPAAEMGQAEGSSSVSALMAGNAVGAEAVIDLRHPASPFIP